MRHKQFCEYSSRKNVSLLNLSVIVIMKKTSPPSPDSPSLESGKPTFVRAITKEQARKLFVDSLPKAKEGSNSHVDDFLDIAYIVLNAYPTFTMNDFLTLSRYKTLPAAEIKQLFGLWADKMVSLGQLEVQTGCYDFATYTNIFI